MHNRDMERKMLYKFKEDRRSGEIRFVKDSPKHRLIVPQGGGAAGGEGVGGANRAAAVAVANMKRMLSAAMGGPDSPLMLKSDSLHPAYAGGDVRGGGSAVDGQQAGQQQRHYQEQQQQRRGVGEAAVGHHLHHHHLSQGAVSGEGSGVGDSAHNSSCLLRNASAQHAWSAYGSSGPAASGLGAAAAPMSAIGTGGSVGSSPFNVALLKSGNASSAAILSSSNSSSNKHGGHEGHFGYNQSNMMQRGTPATMAGYSNLPGRSGHYRPPPLALHYNLLVLIVLLFPSTGNECWTKVCIPTFCHRSGTAQ